MATTRRPGGRRDEDDEDVAPPRGKATMQERIAAFAMLDEMDAARKTQAEKTLRLWLVGFTNPEIAQMLQTTSAVVSQNLYAMRKGGGKRGRRTSLAGDDEA